MPDPISPERLAEINDRIPPGDHPWRLEPRIVASGLDEWEEGFEIWTALEDGDHLVAGVHDEFDPADEECDGESGIISVQIDATHDIHPDAKGVADFILHARDDMKRLLAEVDRLTAELAKTADRLEWLDCLEAAGIDNSPAYDYACQLRREAALKTGTHTYDVIVWLMEDNRIFGADGWTWCKVIDGDPDDYTGDLPRCADEADARAKAAAWLASVTATESTAEEGPA